MTKTPQTPAPWSPHGAVNPQTMETIRLTKMTDEGLRTWYRYLLSNIHQHISNAGERRAQTVIADAEREMALRFLGDPR